MAAQLRLLSVVFDTPIYPWELPAFRGAAAARAGYEHELFHNNETGGYHYRFPLIHYKHNYGRPMLVCLNEGIEELHHFFSQPDWTLDLNGRAAPVRIHSLDVHQCSLEVSERHSRYHIRHGSPSTRKTTASTRACRGCRSDSCCSNRFCKTSW